MSNVPERIGTGVNCPDCGGHAQVFGFASSRDDSKDYGIRCDAGYRPCPTCEGTGAVTYKFMRRYEKGRAMRQNRISRGVSLREEADRIGITPVDLSSAERGREVSPEVEHKILMARI